MMHPGDEWLYGWDEMPDEPERIIEIVERIRLYTCSDAMPWYAEQRIEQEVEAGMERFDEYLARHAEFDAWLAEHEVEA